MTDFVNGFEFDKKRNLKIRQGATGRFSLIFGFDLTGYTARLEIARRNKANLNINLTTENDGITIDAGAEESTVTVDCPAGQTGALADNYAGVYNFELISAAGEVTRLMEGRVSLSAEVAVNP
jgi:hypothetical protein